MTQPHPPAGGTSAPRPFLVVVWAALLTALLSALLPVGLPHSTAVGSAFNPATTSVALKAGTYRTVVAAESVATGDDDAGTGFVTPRMAMSLLQAPDVAELSRRVPATPLPPDISTASPLPRRIFSDAFPRGPPLR